MNENEIQSLAVRLISKLEIKQDTKAENDNFDKIKGVSQIISIDTVLDFKTNKTDLSGSNVDAYTTVEGKQVGLSIDNYSLLKDIAFHIIKNDLVVDEADYEFIEEYIFNWLIDVYKNKRIGKGLIHYLQDSIELESKLYTFYYKLKSIGIEEPLLISNVNIIYVDQNFIQTLFKKDTDKQIIKDFTSEYEGSVIAKVKAKGTHKRAETLAANQVTLAIDCLKIFYINYSLDINNQIFDVDFRFNSNTLSSCFYTEDHSIFSMRESYHRIGGSAPTIIWKINIEQFNKKGLSIISNFILKNNSDELYIEIIKAIQKLGDITSTRNMYERIVKIISYFEGILVPKSNTKSLGITYLKNNLLNNIKSLIVDKDSFVTIIIKCYEIRDKYLHNRVELRIDYNYLYCIQDLAVKFLFDIIEFNEYNHTLDGLHQKYQIKQK